MEKIYIFNGKPLDVNSVKFNGPLDKRDYSEFTKISIISINFMDNTPLSNEQLYTLNENFDLVYKLIEEHIK